MLIFQGEIPLLRSMASRSTPNSSLETGNTMPCAILEGVGPVLKGFSAYSVTI